MNNPYKVLGLSEDASQEEIRSAYLRLVKKYHPDKYTDPVMKELANDKLVEINEAYDALTKKAGSTSASGGYSDYNGYSGRGSAYSGPFAAEFARARGYINAGNLAAAKDLLDSIQVRNAEWYYLYGLVYFRQGWYDKANDFLSRAYHQEPGNAEYANAYRTVQNNANPYSRGNATYQGTSCSGCDICSGLLCADCCCEMAGGDCIPCC